MSKELSRQLKSLEKAEQKILHKKENGLMKHRINPLKGKIMEKIPDKLSSTLQVAFTKSFELLYEKGDVLIEKTFKKDDRQMEHELLNYALDKDLNKRYIKRMDKQAGQSNLLNTSFSVVEGGVLGFLGIGLPDIPLFIAVVLRNIYEIALSYGYDNQSEEEKFYILVLINTALAQGERQIKLNDRLDVLGSYIDDKRALKLNLKKQMEITGETLAEAMLVAKFIQGIPVVGTVGGIVNYSIIRRISQYAGIKYKKRYLLKKIKSQGSLTD